MDEYLTLAELAEAAGVPARTIRFYIARGLVEGPVKAGRGAAYTAAHLARLERVKSLQAEGRMLSEIGRIVGGVEAEYAAEPTAWWQHAVADDVVVWTRADMSPWRTRQVRAAVDELARFLHKERKE
jgi:DNA-binding transcriptional MerR regulator